MGKVLSDLLGNNRVKKIDTQNAEDFLTFFLLQTEEMTQKLAEHSFSLQNLFTGSDRKFVSVILIYINFLFHVSKSVKQSIS